MAEPGLPWIGGTPVSAQLTRASLHRCLTSQALSETSPVLSTSQSASRIQRENGPVKTFVNCEGWCAYEEKAKIM